MITARKTPHLQVLARIGCVLCVSVCIGQGFDRPRLFGTVNSSTTQSGTCQQSAVHHAISPTAPMSPSLKMIGHIGGMSGSPLGVARGEPELRIRGGQSIGPGT